MPTISPMMTWCVATTLASLIRQSKETRLVATHHVIIGEIVGIRLGENGPALIYQNRLYRELTA